MSINNIGANPTPVNNEASAPPLSTPAKTAPLSTPVQAAKSQSAFQRVVQWIKHLFACFRPALPALGHQAQVAAIAQPLVETPLRERPAQVVISNPEASPTLAATTLSKAIDTSGIDLVVVKTKEDVHTGTVTVSENHADVAPETFPDEADPSPPVSAESPAPEQKWDDGFTGADHNMVSSFVSDIRLRGGASDPLSQTQFGAFTTETDSGGVRAFLGNLDDLKALATTVPISTSSDPLISDHLARMRMDDPKAPVYDAQRTAPTAFTSQRAISPDASDRELVSAFLTNLQHSIGNGAIGYQPDVAGAFGNVRTRLGDSPRGTERAKATEQLISNLGANQLAPIGRNATFSITRPQSTDGNAVRTLSEYTLPPDSAFTQRMQDAMAQEGDEFAAYDADHIVATPFAARAGASDAALHIEPPKLGAADTVRARLSGTKKTQIQTLSDACFKNDEMMVEVTRHLHPDSINKVVTDQFGNGNRRMIIDGTHIELANAAPNCKYTVRSGAPGSNGQKLGVVHVTIEAQWDIQTFMGDARARHSPLGGAKSTFTAVANFDIVPQYDAGGDLVARQGPVTLTASTAIANVIHFDKKGTMV